MECSQHLVSTADGVQISFDLYQGIGRKAVVVICPGFFQSKETPTFKRLSGILAEEWDVICMDFRGHGHSRGLFTFSACETKDLEAVLEWARERYSHIGILGFSLGAATAINVASQKKSIQALIAVSAPSTFEDIEFKFWTPEAIQTGIAGLEPGAGCRPGNLWLKKARPVEHIRSLSPTPVLFIHGTKDRTVLHQHSERLYQAAGEPKRLVLIPEGRHAEELFREKPEQFLPLIQEWLRMSLSVSSTVDSEGVRHEEGYFEAGQKNFLYYQGWLGSSTHTPLVIVHGAGEYSGRYTETAKRFVQEGYAVYAFDLPGHGHSPGKRGHIRRFEEYLTCVEAFVRKVTQEHAGDQPILLGHSLGGLIATFYAIAYPETIRCLVLSSPLWGLSVRVPLWKHLCACCLSPFWPSLTMERPRVGESGLSHDPEVGRRYLGDPLVHFWASARLYTELQRKFRELPKQLAELKIPVLLLQAGEDHIASARAVKNLFEKIGSLQKRLIVYEGYYHEVFNEVEKERVFEDVTSWLRVDG